MHYHHPFAPHVRYRGHTSSTSTDSSQAASAPNCGARRGRAARAILVFILALVPVTAAIAATSEFPLFDGTDDRVIVRNGPELNPSEGITIEAWVRPSTTSGCQTIVGKDFNTGYWLGLCNGVVRYYTNGSGSAEDGTGQVPVGEWTHVAITFDGVFRRYYINGVEDLLLVSLDSIALPINLADVGIGGEAAFTSLNLFEFTGSLAEVRIWSQARSREEIRHDMTRQLSGDEPGLQGNWPLDGGFGEVAGRHDSFPAGNPVFTSLPSPVTLHSPLHVPRLGVTPNIDANCELAEYSDASPLPVWYPTDAPQGSPTFGLAGADPFGYFLCLENFEVPPGSWFEIWFDRQADSGGLTIDGDDLKFRVHADGSHQVFEGTGNPLDPWQEIAAPPGFDFATPSEFFRGLELRVSRSEVESADGEIFQTAFGVLWNEAEPSFHGWPRQDAVNWEPARILSDPPRPDAERPTITVEPVPLRPVGGEPVTWWARASDDVDLRQIEIFVDPLDGGSPTVPEHVCIDEIAGENDVEGICEFNMVLAPGVYTYKARSIDHRGKIRDSRARTVRLTLGGEAPSVTVSHTPRQPSSGEAVTLVASARDDVGIDHISIHVNAESLTCDPAGSPTEAGCSWELDEPGGVVRYMAWAEDVEGLRARSPHRIALVGNNGPDNDGDGIGDAHELVYLCTNPDLRDTDKDGLEDGWELFGLEFADGTRTDLPALGAYPCSRDVFVQIDYETGAQFPNSAIDLAVGRYLANGIKLHIEENERPRPPTDPMSPLTAPRASFQLDADGNRYFDPRLNWTHHYAYLSHSVGRGWSFNRFVNVSRYFGFGPVGHCFGGDNAGEACLSNGQCDSGNCGRACASGPLKGAACSSNAECPASTCTDNFECPLSAANPANCGGRLRRGEFDLSYRLIHEIGHSVGLGHGGRRGPRSERVNADGFFYLVNAWDDINHKPNYQSVMNYKGGLATDICLEPPFDVPRLKGRFDYSHDELPALDETDLDERFDSEFATALRGLDCPDSEDPDARPVVLYYCRVEDEDGLTGEPPRRYFVISDGTRTMWRQPEGGGWSGDVPEHEPGIDWNCDGAIEESVSGSVNGSGGHVGRAWGFFAERCDGSDDDGDGSVDEGCDWNDGEVHERKADWSNLPNLPDCHWIYSNGRECYVQVESYRNEIPGLASGVPPQDCRPEGMPADTCDASVVIDFSGAAARSAGAHRMHDIYSAALADRQDSRHAGIANGDPSAEDRIKRLPGLEVCNGVDDDSDGVIDGGCPDDDGDGIVDALDSCPKTPNADQIDSNGDRVGDACQDPRVSGLTAVWSNGAARLEWEVSHSDILGFAVYRREADDATPGFVGMGYPTTIGASLTDATGASPHPLRYTVHAVNLDGEESRGVAVTVDAGVLFSDSFEDQ